MKNIILSLLSFFLVTGITHGQDTKKAFSDAKKAFGVYNLDPQNNKAKLGEGQQWIDMAITGAQESQLAKTWQLRGDIYNEIATQMVAAKQLNLDAGEIPQVNDPAGEAFPSYVKALELAEKQYETKDALRGLRMVQSNLYNMGIFAYDDKNYDLAYTNFKSIIEAHNLLKQNGSESSLDEQENYFDNLYITGLAALNANRTSDAASLFQELYENNYDKPAIYEALYKIKMEESGPEAAYQYLATGRQKHPDDVSLLFAEINHFLRMNKLDELIAKLELAIEKEPDNLSLYATLGNVYDNLYQQAQEAGDVTKAEAYFNSALKYYNDALAKDPNYFDAIYSVGALYYNKAAAQTMVLNALFDDMSAEGVQKYENKKAEVFAIFDQALPYFKKAESMNPNDLNTLIALKEIFARKDQLDISNEFKRRIDTVQAGGRVASSYFNN